MPGDAELRDYASRLSVSLSADADGSSSSSSSSVDAILLFKQVNGVDHFIGICSPIDLARVPVDAPDESGLFRVASASWDFRNRVLMDQFWAALELDVQALASAQNSLAALDDVDVVSFDISPDDAPGTVVYTLTRDAVSLYPVSAPTGYRLRVVCAALGADPNVFLRRNEQASLSASATSRPIAVCSAGDMADYPVGAPTGFPAYFRGNEFDITSRNVYLLKHAWDTIQFDVRKLVESLRALRDEGETDYVEI